MLPEAFTKRMKTLLAEEYGAFLDSFSRPRAVALRLNPLKTQAPPDLSGFSLRPVPWEPCGFYYDPETRPGKSAYHEAGLYYLQEASAMAPAALLDPQPGERVLDLCAAPGGKSTQLAGKMRGRTPGKGASGLQRDQRQARENSFREYRAAGHFQRAGPERASAAAGGALCGLVR